MDIQKLIIQLFNRFSKEMIQIFTQQVNISYNIKDKLR